MTAATAYFRTYDLPWTPGAESEERFRRILRNILILCLGFMLVMPWLPVKQLDRQNPQLLPPRMTKLLLDREPVFAGVDPYNMRIDRNSDDNVRRVDVAR